MSDRHVERTSTWAGGWSPLPNGRTHFLELSYFEAKPDVPHVPLLRLSYSHGPLDSFETNLAWDMVLFSPTRPIPAPCTQGLSPKQTLGIRTPCKLNPGVIGLPLLKMCCAG